MTTLIKWKFFPLQVCECECLTLRWKCWAVSSTSSECYWTIRREDRTGETQGLTDVKHSPRECGGPDNRIKSAGSITEIALAYPGKRTDVSGDKRKKENNLWLGFIWFQFRQSKQQVIVFCCCCVLFLQFKWSKLHQTKRVIPHLERIWLVSISLEAMVTWPTEDDETTAAVPNLFVPRTGLMSASCFRDWPLGCGR